MDLGKLSNGEQISSVSAILRYAFMSFDWFSVKASSGPQPPTY